MTIWFPVYLTRQTP